MMFETDELKKFSARKNSLREVQMYYMPSTPESLPNDDAFWFVDEYVTVRDDGTPVLTVTVDEFEERLRRLLEERTA